MKKKLEKPLREIPGRGIKRVEGKENLEVFS